jgi:hypothetical protein
LLQCAIFGTANDRFGSNSPASLTPWRNAATRCPESADVVLRRNPITGIAGCCARAMSGHTAAEQRDELAACHSITSSARC